MALSRALMRRDCPCNPVNTSGEEFTNTDQISQGASVPLSTDQLLHVIKTGYGMVSKTVFNFYCKQEKIIDRLFKSTGHFTLIS